MTRPTRYLLLAVILAGTGLAWALAVWQGNRLAARRAANRQALAARDLPALDLTAGAVVTPPDYQRVVMEGSWDDGVRVVLRGRVEDGTPGVMLVSGFRPARQDSLVLVNRGFVPSPDAASLDTGLVAPPPSGVVTISGYLFRLPDDPDGGAPLARARDTTWRRLNATSLRAAYAGPVAGYSILFQRDTGSPTWPRPVSPPPLDDGPHLSYMLQWFGIGAAILAFGVMFILRGGPKRGEREQETGNRE